MIAIMIIFIFGLAIGSFLNVCIYRMPKEESIIRPRSYCPHCKRLIFWYDNIPLLSYIILKGRCRFCKGKIPFRYFLVELLTGCLFIFLFKHYGLSFDFIFYSVFFCGLIVASFVDISHRIIPDEISLGGIVLGFILNIFKGMALHSWLVVKDSFLGIFIGAGIIYFTGKVFDLFYFKLLKRPPIDGEIESMGFGDVKFLSMIGAFLGWQRVILTFFIAPVIGTFFGLINLWFTKKHTLPYGPFLSLASFVSLFWGKTIIDFYLFRLWL